VCGRYNWVVHAYCLMTNHSHALLETPDGNLFRGCVSSTTCIHSVSIAFTVVSQGKAQPLPWEKLKNQVYLGSDHFVEEMQDHLEPIGS